MLLAAGCAFQINVNFRGANLPDMPTTAVSSRDKCSERCTNEPTCEYFVYNSGTKECWLKKDYEAADVATGLTSGFRCGQPCLANTHSVLSVHAHRLSLPKWYIHAYTCACVAIYVRGLCQDMHTAYAALMAIACVRFAR